MNTLDIFRKDDTLLLSVKLTEKSQQFKAVMGENIITLDFENSFVIPFKITDYCIVWGEKYLLNELPVIKKTASNYYDYNVKFTSENLDLSKALFLFLGDDNTLKQTEFSFNGKAEAFIDLVITNINRIQTGWIKGQVIGTIAKNMTFKGENCLEVLGRLAKEFNTEFWIEGKTIHLTKRQKDTGFTFKVGQNRGLYEITAYNVDNTSIITRLFVEGSEKNLPPDYNNYNKRLQMRSKDPITLDEPNLLHNVLYTVVDNGDGTETINFTWDDPINAALAVSIQYKLVNGTTWMQDTGSVSSPRSITVPVGTYSVRFVTQLPDTTTAVTKQITVTTTIIDEVLPSLDYPVLNYIQRNTDLYGFIEGVIYLDDIFPHRTGKVTAVNAADPLIFVDATIDFNLLDQRVPGLSPKVTFNSGQLAGYTFEIIAFDDATKTVTVLQNKNETKLEVPGSLIRPKIGDEYVFIDIEMPKSYIVEAENKLYDEGKLLLDLNSSPQITITAKLDEKYMKIYNKQVYIGNTVWVEDLPLGIARKIRIVSITRNLVRENLYDITLQDVIGYRTIERIITAAGNTARTVSGISDTIHTQDIFNNRLILPASAGGAGFQDVIVDPATNQLYRKV